MATTDDEVVATCTHPERARDCHYTSQHYVNLLPPIKGVFIRKRMFSSELVIIQQYKNDHDTLRAAAVYQRVYTASDYPDGTGLGDLVKIQVDTRKCRVKLRFRCADPLFEYMVIRPNLSCPAPSALPTEWPFILTSHWYTGHTTAGDD